MRIGIDCRLWGETGVGRYIRNLVEQLQIIDKVNDYTLFVLSKDCGEFKVQSSKCKVKVADIRWHTLGEQVKFPQILNRENLDLVHFPYHSVPIFYNKPFVLTIHDLIPYNYPTGQASTLPAFLYWSKLLAYKYVLKNAAKKTRKIIAVSNATKKEIRDHLKVEEKKIAVIYEGADSSKFPSSVGRQVQSSKLQFKVKDYFLYVGNAFPHKNLERMLAAFAMMNDKGLRINLILVGKEDYFYKRLLEKAKSMGLSEKIILKQNISDEELANLYQNAKALIMPSLMEGFGLPALEAMVNKCLVLASDIPAFHEVCGDTAIYFDPYNIQDIAKKMYHVCSNNSNHRSRIEKGLEQAKFFSWRKMAEETIQIYENVVLNP